MVGRRTAWWMSSTRCLATGGRFVITIIAPCRNEAGFIGGFLESVARFDAPQDAFELLVVDGQSDDGTREALAAAQAKHPWLRVIDNPRRITPVALNLGIAAAQGDFIAPMDIHVDYSGDKLAELIRWAREMGADNPILEAYSCGQLFKSINKE